MQTTNESELFKSTFEKQQHKCYFCGKELKENEAFLDKVKYRPTTYAVNPKPEDNCFILCKDCTTKRSWNDIYLKYPLTGELINNKGKPVTRKSTAGGAVLAFLFGWLGLFYSNKTYAIIALFVWIGVIVLCRTLLAPFPVLVIIVYLLYMIACAVFAVKAVKKQQALYDECMKHE